MKDLSEVASGKMNPSALRRTANRSQRRRIRGFADFTTGTTMAPAVEVARQMVSVPLLRVDEAMASSGRKRDNQAGRFGRSHGRTELPNLKDSSEEMGKRWRSLPRLPQAGCYSEGKIDQHDALVLEKVSARGKVDVIVLARFRCMGP